MFTRVLSVSSIFYFYYFHSFREIDLVVQDGPTSRHLASIDQSCSLKVFEKLPDHDLAMGIIARKNWSWRRRINTAITYMTLSGEIDYLIGKWFRHTPCKKATTYLAHWLCGLVLSSECNLENCKQVEQKKNT